MEVFLGFPSETKIVETETVAMEERAESPIYPDKAATEEPGMEKGVGAGGSAGGSEELQRGSEAASTCTLWCTVAMGALVQGQPPERVRQYFSAGMICSPPLLPC